MIPHPFLRAALEALADVMPGTQADGVFIAQALLAGMLVQIEVMYLAGLAEPATTAAGEAAELADTLATAVAFGWVHAATLMSANDQIWSWISASC